MLYTLSVAAMIAAGAIALLFACEASVCELREISEIAIAASCVLFVGGRVVLWRRPAVVSTLAAGAPG